MGFDLDDLTDAVSDAVDTIGDAGDVIGGILKTVSPILGAIPGIGTAFAVAVYAAGAIAAKDTITDAMLGTASAAMPPGIPRIAFDGATNVVRDVANGRDVESSAINACRSAADQAGGAPAVAAFDSGRAVLKGGEVDQRIIDQGRAFALQGGGQAAAASFDAGVSIARSRGADQVAIDVARGYIKDVGGPVALSAFDTGIALAYGKTLQEAGYVGLHTFVRGNDVMEKVLNFVEQLGRAKSLRMGVQQLLEGELTTDFLHAVSPSGVSVSAEFIDETLKPYIDTIREHLELLDFPAGELAKQWGVDEAIAREAQALMRSGDGRLDADMLTVLKAFAAVASQGSFDFSEKTPEANDRLAVRGRQIIDAGAKWRGVLLSDIRKGSTFTITHPRFDALSGITSLGTDRFEINDAWRRAFDIGIGTAEGTSQDNPAQVHANAVVAARLGGGGGGGGGFSAAEAIQFERTRLSRRFQGTDALSASSILTAASSARAGVTDAIARDARLLARSSNGTTGGPSGEASSARLKRMLVPRRAISVAVSALPKPRAFKESASAASATAIQALAHDEKTSPLIKTSVSSAPAVATRAVRLGRPK